MAEEVLREVWEHARDVVVYGLKAGGALLRQKGCED